ncbi:hypothetical protein, partial [Actinotalea ferrariae]|uniref:hypothetical protein n=1 Tax=Actinotalea ferrariae TaxID=1386098 RepID=UPI001C1DF34D
MATILGLTITTGTAAAAVTNERGRTEAQRVAPAVAAVAPAVAQVPPTETLAAGWWPAARRHRTSRRSLCQRRLKMD